MKSLLTLIALLIATSTYAQNAAAKPDGTILAEGDFCYTITADHNGAPQPIGLTFQSVHRQQLNGMDALAIVVHQHLNNVKFDLRDSFLLRRADLRPITLDTTRDGTPHVHLDYSADQVTGWKMVEGKRQAIDVPLDGPTWDGNLWGELFAALPLRAGAAYQLPVYQYDTGKGSFFIDVVAPRQVDSPEGPVDGWLLHAGLKPSQQVDYFVGSQRHLELGYSAGPSSQHLGGQCGDLH